MRDSPEFELAPEIAPRADEAVFDKTAMSAFEGTPPLNTALRDLGMASFVIVGVATEVGIEPTVRHATDLGLVPIVVSDACSGRDETAIRRAYDGFAFEGSPFVTDVATVVPLLRG